MPDSNNLPTGNEIIQRIATIQSDADPLTFSTVPGLLLACVAHFQSPPGQNNTGGTGRAFVPVTETRYFDGNNMPQLRVDDIVPNTTLGVSVWSTPLPDVLLKTAGYGLGYNILALPQGGGFLNASSLLVSGIFPAGVQNIAVTATWGKASTVTDDIRESILGEVAYQAIVMGIMGVNGTGEDITMEGFELNTSVGAINFETTSPLPVMHNKYLDCVETWRVSKMEKIKRFVRGMS